jgi:hypothetical protein
MYHLDRQMDHNQGLLDLAVHDEVLLAHHLILMRLVQWDYKVFHHQLDLAVLDWTVQLSLPMGSEE